MVWEKYTEEDKFPLLGDGADNYGSIGVRLVFIGSKSILTVPIFPPCSSKLR